ncbi:hypothetical protein PPL_04717 [Heterostelium album PN500]|uniref:Pesticidal crystal protein domain-containing protein n=1 Tax=Heterostelium pallidum (strain ATCC 26659 / Pp 5 / PN500) TaxID=670386 RepID=D3B8C5_HETP5|nr:hypothetical protein PPL_04717 [Heterostelium album PN500]EFA82293.1 hypothetical protein PPL_04717 [Heterostelium album PN500]|eukprot:XP_020434410.1 hypothetical protein PPL_04717 [Heterostelium album PN500]
MNRKAFALFFLVLICAQLFIDVADAAAKKPKKKKKPQRPLALEADKRMFLKNNLDFINEYISPVSTPFRDSEGNGIGLTEFFKAMVVGFLAFDPVTAVAAVFIDSIWSAFIENNSEDKNDAITRAYIQMVKEIVDQKIEVYDQSIIWAEYTIINASIVSFKDSVVVFNEDPSEVNSEAVRTDFTTLEKDLRGRLDPNGGLRKKGWELSELPVFALATTLYFMAQVDLQRNGVTWGFSQGQLDKFKRYYDERMGSYLQYVKDTYKSGYDKIMDATPEADRDTSTLNKINRYRRTMIPQVMDYAAIWWTFNSTLFPTTAYGERVRYLYSDVLGQPIDRQKTPSFDGSYYDPTLARLIEMADYLERERYRGEIASVKIGYKLYEWIWSIQPTYVDETQPDKKRVGLSVGNPSPPSGGYVSIDIQRTVYRPSGVLVVWDVFPQLIEIYDNTTHRAGEVNFMAVPCFDRPGQTYCNTYYNNGGQLNSVYWQMDSHKIGDMIGWSENKKIGVDGQSALDAFQVAFVPMDVYSNNLILRNVATVIDAQKSMKYKNALLFKDFVMPGVHAVTVFDKGYLSFIFDSDYKANKKFTIFLRVHSNQPNEGKLSLKRGPDAKDPALATFTIKANVRDQSVFPDTAYEIQLQPGETNNTFYFVATGKGIQLQSIVFIPK